MISGQLELDVPPSQSGGALISDDGLYRYNLWRRWGDGLLLGFCMLNPSIADGTQDDQTVRRCCYYAKREGFSGIYVINLFAYRATDQTHLWGARSGVGPDNNIHIAAAIHNDRIGQFVAAWGALPEAARYRQHAVRTMFSDGGRPLLCLGRTKAGWPRHPSRLGNTVALEPFDA